MTMPGDAEREHRESDRRERLELSGSDFDAVVKSVDASAASFDALASKADSIGTAIEHAEDTRQRERRRDRIMYLGALAVVLVVAAFGVINSNRSSSAATAAKNAAELVRSGQVTGQQVLAQNTKILEQVLSVTSPEAQAAAQVRTAQLIKQLTLDIEHCNANRIDYDLKGTPVDPACAPA